MAIASRNKGGSNSLGALVPAGGARPLAGARSVMNLASLYPAFGDKEARFRVVHDRYTDDAPGQIHLSLASEPEPRAAIAATLLAAAALYADGAAPRGCLAIYTLPTEAVSDPEPRSAAATMIAAIDRLAPAVPTGALPTGF